MLSGALFPSPPSISFPQDYLAAPHSKWYAGAEVRAVGGPRPPLPLPQLFNRSSQPPPVTTTLSPTHPPSLIHLIGSTSFINVSQEMIGLCAILAPDAATDPVKYLGRAFDHYSRLPGRQARMLATRAMVACAMYQTAAGRWVGGRGGG